MKILIACEFSGIVRDAFTAKGHDAVSVDLLVSERPGKHVIADVRNLLSSRWDMMIAFPPCTYLSRTSFQWHNHSEEQHDALLFVFDLLEAPIKRICLENPIGAINTSIEKPTQIIQPWQFGHGETKATCLWLENLPPLKPTCIVNGRKPRSQNEKPGPDRWKRRSRTLPGIANAMAEQWNY